jgi:hypothetical protein
MEMSQGNLLYNYHILISKKLKKNTRYLPGVVVYTYNPSYSGGGDREDYSSRPA